MGYCQPSPAHPGLRSYQHMHGLVTLCMILMVPVLQAVGADEDMPSPVAVLRRVVSQQAIAADGGGLDSGLPKAPITPSLLIQILLIVAAMLQFMTTFSAPLWPTVVALVISWAHTRFFRPPPKHLVLPTTNTEAEDASTNLRGDRSDALQFPMLFPAPLRAPVGALSAPVGSVCLRWRLWNLRLPQHSDSERRDGQAAADALFSFSGADGSSDGAQSGFVGLGAAGYTTAASTAGFAGSAPAAAAAAVRDPVAERRRARALQLLDAKLAQMGGGSNGGGGGQPAKASAGGVGATDASTSTSAQPSKGGATGKGSAPSSAQAGSE